MQFINENIEIIIAALFVVVIVQAIILSVLGRKINKMKTSYQAMMDGAGVENLEQVIIGIRQELASHQQNIESSAAKINTLEQRMPKQKSKLGIKRYNAFADSGSDLSFSLAIVDEQKNGVVLTSIHSREGMYVYGKPLQEGQSNYSLTPEERKAIEEAE